MSGFFSCKVYFANTKPSQFMIIFLNFSLPISYTWKRTGGRDFVPGTTISDRGRVLTIVNAPLGAEGGYICTATGKGGVTHKTISVVMES